MSISNEQRKDILRQLAEGEITISDASALLSARETLKENQADEPMFQPDQPLQITKQDLADDPVLHKTEAPKWFHVRVNDLKSGKNRVTVNIPLSLVNMGLKIGQRFTPELGDVDWREVSGALNDESGVLIDVTDETDGEHVLIYVD